MKTLGFSGLHLAFLVVVFGGFSMSCGKHRKDTTNENNEVQTVQDETLSPEQRLAAAEIARCTGIDPSDVAITSDLTDGAATDWCKAADKMNLAGAINEEANFVEI